MGAAIAAAGAISGGSSHGSGGDTGTRAAELAASVAAAAAGVEARVGPMVTLRLSHWALFGADTRDLISRVYRRENMDFNASSKAHA